MHSPSKNERVALEMQILNYQNLLPRITDDQFQMRAKEMIAELEQKLREIDE
jgi:formiminotetrahydrofolate cyclodeaminase